MSATNEVVSKPRGRPKGSKSKTTTTNKPKTVSKPNDIERGLLYEKYMVELGKDITIVCPAASRQEVINSVAEHWSMIHDGPYTDEQMWPMVDPSRVIMTFQKRIPIQVHNEMVSSATE